MTENDIIMQLANYGDHIRRYEIILPNVFTQFDNEADLFCVRKSGLCDEFEIKTSRSDFLADKNKFVRYRDPVGDECNNFSWEDRRLAANYKNKHQALADGDMSTNYFWFAVAEGVATVDDMPSFAGLIIIKPDSYMRIEKTPERLHSKKMSIEDRYKIARKSTYRFWKLKNELEAMK